MLKNIQVTASPPAFPALFTTSYTFSYRKVTGHFGLTNVSCAPGT